MTDQISLTQEKAKTQPQFGDGNVVTTSISTLSNNGKGKEDENGKENVREDNTYLLDGENISVDEAMKKLAQRYTSARSDFYKQKIATFLNGIKKRKDIQPLGLAVSDSNGTEAIAFRK